eukprot:CAMPEP_0195509638 /NCGR_PEP_ID=MMETSP0794_2-20130614/2516_1 /TAXON_ID=515487 /ORGANISM="Stephanopyxis turris, Strain CCMP 815" /LENGTH=231 /DNA_ID=CAMNT_0040636909 /DNA_START=85 /DNA_END=780 /DNA_ORIENTATION=+
MATTTRSIPTTVRKAEDQRISNKVEHNLMRTTQIKNDSSLHYLVDKKHYAENCSSQYYEFASSTMREEVDVEHSQKIDCELKPESQTPCDTDTGCSSSYSDEGRNDQLNEYSQKQNHPTKWKIADSCGANYKPSVVDQEQPSPFKGKAGNWHRHARDLPLRRHMIGKIVKILKIQERSAIVSPTLSKKVPIMVKHLEMSLYKTAPSLYAYGNNFTLKQRLLDLAGPLCEKP